MAGPYGHTPPFPLLITSGVVDNGDGLYVRQEAEWVKGGMWYHAFCDDPEVGEIC